MRAALVILLALGLGGFLVVPQRPAVLLALLLMLIAFLLGSAKLALGLIDLIPAELAADALTVAALAFALTRVTTGNRLLVAALLGVALATQVAPPVARRMRTQAT